MTLPDQSAQLRTAYRRMNGEGRTLLDRIVTALADVHTQLFPAVPGNGERMGSGEKMASPAMEK